MDDSHSCCLRKDPDPDPDPAAVSQRNCGTARGEINFCKL